MNKYNEELVATYVERELGKFIHENNEIINCTVGETILIMQATTDYINDLLMGITSREQRSLVVDSTMEHSKKMMLSKVGKYEEYKKKIRQANRQSDT